MPTTGSLATIQDVELVDKITIPPIHSDCLSGPAILLKYVKIAELPLLAPHKGVFLL
jgi:hypothetical protein